jgi:hypothetical protein
VSISATRTSITDSELAAAQIQFQQFRAVACQHLLAPELLATVQRLCDTGIFVSNSTQPGHREVESPQRAGRILNLALNRPEFLLLLEQVTGCGRLVSIGGSVAQTHPRPGDELTWHDDLVEPHRRLALVIHLGSAAYEGGNFELRRKHGEKRGELLAQYRHTEPGSALFFAVDSALEHRVLPLSAGGPRRVFAGWAFAESPTE